MAPPGDLHSHARHFRTVSPLSPDLPRLPHPQRRTRIGFLALLPLRRSTSHRPAHRLSPRRRLAIHSPLPPQSLLHPRLLHHLRWLSRKLGRNDRRPPQSPPRLPASRQRNYPRKTLA